MNKIITFSLFFLGTFLIINNADAASVDLELQDISVSPAKPAINQEVTIKARIKVKYGEISSQLGLDSYSANFNNFTFTKSAIPVISKKIEAGGVIEYVFNGFYSQKGEHSLSFNFNTNKELDEMSYSNNNSRTKVNVIPAYDVYITGIELSPENPIPDQSVVILVNVKNNGVRDMTSEYGLQSPLIEFDDFNLSVIDIPSPSSVNPLKVGGTDQYRIEGKFSSSGSKNLKMTLNVNGDLDESNTDNNVFTKSVVVEDEGNNDIFVEKIFYDIESGKDYVLLDENVDIVVRVLNIGQTSFDSGEGLLGSSVFYEFEDFKMLSSTFPDTPSPTNLFLPKDYLEYRFGGYFKTPGDKKVYFEIDKNNYISELDENNNFIEDVYRVFSSDSEANLLVFSDIKIEAVSTSSLRMKWKTDKESSAVIKFMEPEWHDYNYYLESIKLREWPEYSGKVLEHELVIKNLPPGKGFNFLIEGYKNGQKTNSDLNWFKLPDSDSLRAQSISHNIQPESIEVSWMTNILSSSCLMVATPGVDFKKVSLNNYVIDHKIDIDIIKPGEYKYYECSDKDKVVSVVISEKDENLEENESNNDEKNISVDIDTSKSGETKEVKNKKMHSNLKGKIILKVESNGEAYYVSPGKEEMYYLGRPKDAFSVMREQGVGITNKDLYKIPVGVLAGGADSDEDGLPDNLEDALGLDSKKADTDGDGHSDKEELLGGYNPWGAGKQNLDNNFSEKQKGKILLQVEKNGEAWYVNPGDGKRYFLGRPADAFSAMRGLGLGISDDNFDSL